MMSMTGYGSSALETEALSAACSVRSLNHRYLDLTVHAPRRLAFLEPVLKDLLAARVQRGRVELVLRASLERAAGDEVCVASGLADALVLRLRELQARHGLAGEVTVADVARVPGVIEVAESSAEGDPELRAALVGLATRALDGLDVMRAAEGRRLKQELQRLLAEIEAAASRLRALSEAAREARLAALIERGRALVQELGLDDARLYQELARLVDRGDVNEELQRLGSHAQQCQAVLDENGPVGKRLDFLAQELMREANTLGSKAGSGTMVHEVVALKAAIERWREQVQNVE
jgi:uncharacterized protein (TIGR00255 family)